MIHSEFEPTLISLTVGVGGTCPHRISEIFLDMYSYIHILFLLYYYV